MVKLQSDVQRNKRREPTKTPLLSNRGCRIPLAQRQTSTQGSSLASEPDVSPSPPLGGHIMTPRELCDSEIACARRTYWRLGTCTILCWPTPTKFRMSLSGHQGARGAFWSSSFARPQWLVFALASSRVPRANPAMPRYENPDDVEKDNRASEVVRRISRKNCARDGGWFSSPGVVINACIVFPNCPTHALLHQHVRLVPSFSLRAASS